MHRGLREQHGKLARVPRTGARSLRHGGFAGHFCKEFWCRRR
jgi:hypothetical protein